MELNTSLGSINPLGHSESFSSITSALTKKDDCFNASSEALTYNLPPSDTLTEIPLEVFHLSHIERLGLSQNKFYTIPRDIFALNNLRYLNLRSNCIREFPLVLCEISTLEILDLSRNKIKQLPADFGTLINVRVLSVSRNRLTELPTCMKDMEYLKILKIENNPIIWPPHSIVHTSDSGDEAWISKLREYLSKEENKFTTLSLPADDTQNPSPSLKDCDVLVHYYFGKRPQKNTYPIFHCAHSIAFAIGILYRGLKSVLTGCIEKHVVTYTTLDKSVRELNRKVIKLLSTLMDNPSSPIPSEDLKKGAELKYNISSCVGDCKRILRYLLENQSWFSNYVDARILRSFMGSINTGFLEIKVLITQFHEHFSIRGRNEADRYFTPKIITSDSDESGGSTSAISVYGGRGLKSRRMPVQLTPSHSRNTSQPKTTKFPSEFFKIANQFCDNTTNTLQSLKSLASILSEQTPGDSSSSSSSILSSDKVNVTHDLRNALKEVGGILNLFTKSLQEGMILVSRIKEEDSVNGFVIDDVIGKQVIVESFLFVKAVIKMNGAAKQLWKSQNVNNPIILNQIQTTVNDIKRFTLILTQANNNNKYNKNR